jgi:hypothetical protein
MVIEQYIFDVILYVDGDVCLYWFPLVDLGLNTNFVT